VLFLEIMRAVQAAAPARDVIFTANSGHELGHLGLDRFIHENPALVKEAHCWIHLGANFGAAIRPQVRLQASDDALFERARAAMRNEGTMPNLETAVGTRALGEARNIFDGRGRYVSLLGGNGLFHHPDDRWPDAVDPEKLAKLARAFCALAVDLAKG
jgi:threonine synthase